MSSTTHCHDLGSSQTGVTLPSRSSGSPSEWRRRRPGGIAGTGACRQEPFGLHSPGRPGLPPCHQSKRVTPKCEERSEEHTSELQSRPHLVCRLLLEKKNI